MEWTASPHDRRRFLGGFSSALLFGFSGCGSNSDEKITNPNLKVPNVPPAASKTAEGRSLPKQKK